MAETGDWVTPRLYGQPWFEKPILYYWAAAIGFRLHLTAEWAARLPSAVAALLRGNRDRLARVEALRECDRRWLRRGGPRSWRSGADRQPRAQSSAPGSCSFSRRASPPSVSPAAPRPTCFSAPCLTLAMASAAHILHRNGRAASAIAIPSRSRDGRLLAAPRLRRVPRRRRARQRPRGNPAGRRIARALGARNAKVARRVPPRASGGDRRVPASSRFRGTRSAPSAIPISCASSSCSTISSAISRRCSAINSLSGSSARSYCSRCFRGPSCSGPPHRRTCVSGAKKRGTARPDFSSPVGPSFPCCSSASRNPSCQVTFSRRFPRSRCSARSARPALRTETRPP